MNEREKLGLPDPNTPLIQAARWNDAIAEEEGFEAACERLGIPVEQLMYIAEQRALRIRFIQTGRLQELGWSLDGRTRLAQVTDPPSVVSLSTEDRKAIETLKAVYLDAVLIGWHGCEIATREDT